MIKQYRKGLPTYYIEYNIEDFYTYSYREHMTTDPIHCPSVELNLIWNEKIFMIQKAYKLNPFQTEWFKWIDAGICIYRGEKPPQTPFPNDNSKLLDLPKDKFIYSSSHEFTMKAAAIYNSYHHISGTYLLHKNMIDKIIELYKEYFNAIVNKQNIRIDKNNIWTDQVILTHIFIDHPHLFYKLCEGYGEITRYLFS
jgi:hypothetical protein